MVMVTARSTGAINAKNSTVGLKTAKGN